MSFTTRDKTGNINKQRTPSLAKEDALIALWDYTVAVQRMQHNPIEATRQLILTKEVPNLPSHLSFGGQFLPSRNSTGRWCANNALDITGEALINSRRYGQVRANDLLAQNLSVDLALPSRATNYSPSFPHIPGRNNLLVPLLEKARWCDDRLDFVLKEHLLASPTSSWCSLPSTPDVFCQASTKKEEKISNGDVFNQTGGSCKQATGPLYPDPRQPVSSLPFPLKLYRLLEMECHHDIIGFLDHGKSFAIFRPQRFMKEILPAYFKTSRLSSFERQLNSYGFRRVSEKSASFCYYNEHFQLGRPDLLSLVKRKKQRTPMGNSSSPSDTNAAIKKAMAVVNRNRHLLRPGSTNF